MGKMERLQAARKEDLPREELQAGFLEFPFQNEPMTEGLSQFTLK